MKIYFINSKEKECGVYQYGLRLWEILKESDLDISYFEIKDLEDFYSLKFDNVDLLFFNFIYDGPHGPFGWYTSQVAQYIKKGLKIQTATIKHTNFFGDIVFDKILDQDPRVGLPRPLFKYESKKQFSNSIKNIGSFGFANGYKGFDSIVKIVNEQFEQVNINLHITKAYYVADAEQILQDTIQKIKDITLKPGINLNIATNFLSNEQLLQFVDSNDLILFGYIGGNFPSSVPDYPLSTSTPIGVTNSPMFDHLYTEQIDIHKHSINEIFDYNISSNYVKNLKEAWSSKNLINAFKQFTT